MLTEIVTGFVKTPSHKSSNFLTNKPMCLYIHEPA